MGKIVAAAVAAHTPPLVLPPERVKLVSPNFETGIKDGLKAMRAAFDRLGFDTLIIIDTHWITTTFHVLAGASHHKGTYSSDEVPAIENRSYDYPGAPDLAAMIVADEGGLAGRVLNAQSPSMPTHYATQNIVEYLQSDQKVLAIGTNQMAEPHNF
jgi:3,4-dihydroxyphenylacetate 2,3-dioxygenase